MGEQVEQCQKCTVLERELDNVKKDVDEMRIDMRGFQRMTQEVEIKYSKIETLITEKFVQITRALGDIKEKMDKDSEDRNENKLTFIGQFVYPSIYSLILVYIAYKLSK